jgi:hypothetical protein
MVIDTPNNELLLMYGLAAKSYSDMTADERQNAARLAFERAKEAAFTRNLPIIYAENGLVIAEYADGQRFIRENGQNLTPYHGEA